MCIDPSLLIHFLLSSLPPFLPSLFLSHIRTFCLCTLLYPLSSWLGTHQVQWWIGDHTSSGGSCWSIGSLHLCHPTKPHHEPWKHGFCRDHRKRCAIVTSTRFCEPYCQNAFCVVYPLIHAHSKLNMLASRCRFIPWIIINNQYIKIRQEFWMRETITHPSSPSFL